MTSTFECNLELICTSEFFKKYQDLTSPQGELNLNFLKKSRLQINFKLNEISRMITYMKQFNGRSVTGSKGSCLLC